MDNSKIDLVKNKFVLGLDISTECIGISVAYINESAGVEPVVLTHLRPKISSKIKGIEALFLKCSLFMDKLSDILKENKLYVEEEGIKKCLITNVVIEEPLINSNNRDTVATLLRYNGMVAQSVYHMLGIIPEFISSYDARKFGVPSLMAVRVYNKKGEMYKRKILEKHVNTDELVLFGDYPFDCAKKNILWNFVSDLYPNIKWVYDKKGELTKENYDASDSMICVFGYIGKVMYGDTTPKVVDAEFSEDEIKYTVDFCGKQFKKRITLQN